MEKITAIVVALVAVFAVNGSDLTNAVKVKITNAVKNGDFVAAAQWSATLNNLKQAEAAEQQTTVLKKYNQLAGCYENLIKSAPAVFAGVSKAMLATEPEFSNKGSESWAMLQAFGLFIKATQKPLGTQDVMPVVDQVISYQKKEAAERAAIRSRWEADRSRRR